MRRSIILLSCLSVFMPGAARSQTIVVDWDGSRDAVTIQEGIDMAPSGAWLRINAGTYYETDITLDGKDLTIWYGIEGVPVIKSPSEGTGTGLILRNVTSGTWVFTLNFESYDTAILIEGGSPQINYCSITSCSTGIRVSGTGGSADLSFNLMEGFATAIDAGGSNDIIVKNNTLAEGTTGIVCSSGSIALMKNIIYRCATGVSCTGGTVISDCNDLWENTLDHSGCAQGATDLFVIPMFCYEAGSSPGPYYLHIDSPCWSTNNTCGVSIGAFTTTYGCTGVATEESTWGRIKQLYSE